MSERVIWKFPLLTRGDNDHVCIAPKGARLLAVDAQANGFVAWAVVDPTVKETSLIGIHIAATGAPLPHGLMVEDFIQTFFVGPLVFHAFRRQTPEAG